MEIDQLRHLFAGAGESVYETLRTAFDSRPPDDWLGGVAIATAPILGLPLTDSCVSGLLEMFPVLEPGNGSELFLDTDDGLRNPTSPRHIAANVFVHAAMSLIWSTNPFDLSTFLDRVDTTVVKVIRWIAHPDAPVEEVHVVGLYNAYLDDGLAIDTEFGTLLAAPHRPVMPAVTSAGPVRFILNMTEWDEVPSAIIVSRRSMRASLVRDFEQPSQPRTERASAESIADGMALAIVLACGHYEHSAPSFAGNQHSSPIAGGAGSGPRVRTGQLPPGVPIPPRVGASVRSYAASIAATPAASPFRFAGRRLCRSLNAGDPEDALVDSVVVWETLFSASPETTFRVTAAVARTLSVQFNDDEPVIAFQSYLAKLYGARSSIVHGNAASVVKLQPELRDYARNAKRYSWRLLRAAFLWPAEMRALDASTRSRMAILNPDWPPQAQPG